VGGMRFDRKFSLAKDKNIICNKNMKKKNNTFVTSYKKECFRIRNKTKKNHQLRASSII